MSDTPGASPAQVPMARCEGCGWNVPARDLFFDATGQRVCRGCKGKQDAATATEQARPKGLRIPFKLIGPVIAIVGFLPLMWLRFGGNLQLVAITALATLVIFLVGYWIDLRRGRA